MSVPTAPFEDEILHKPVNELVRDHEGTTDLWRLAKRAIELDKARQLEKERGDGTD